MVEEEQKPIRGRKKWELTDVRKKLILEYARNGFTNEEMAEMFGISADTLERRLKEPENEVFAGSVRGQKKIADNEIIKSLYNQAKDGNVPAISLWLRNRNAQFDDRQKIEHSGGLGFILRLEEGTPQEEPNEDN